MANSLTLGCDCLGEITYLDAVFCSEHGTPYVVENAVCIHEEDYGILWKHQDMNSGAHRGAPLPSPGGVLHRHGGQLRVRLLLVLLPRRHHPARGQAHRDHVHPGGGPGRGDPTTARGGPGPGRAVPPAPVLRPPRPGGGRAGQRGLRGVSFETAADRGRQSVGQRLPPAVHPPRVRARRPSATSIRPAAGTGGSSTRTSATDWAGRWPTSWCPGPRPPCWPSPTRASAGGPDSPATTCGSRRTPRRAPGGRRLPQPARRRGRTPGVDGGRPLAGRHRHRGLAHLRDHPLRPAPRTGR